MSSGKRPPRLAIRVHARARELCHAAAGLPACYLPTRVLRGHPKSMVSAAAQVQPR